MLPKRRCREWGLRILTCSSLFFLAGADVFAQGRTDDRREDRRDDRAEVERRQIEDDFMRAIEKALGSAERMPAGQAEDAKTKFAQKNFPGGMDEGDLQVQPSLPVPNRGIESVEATNSAALESSAPLPATD